MFFWVHDFINPNKLTTFSLLFHSVLKNKIGIKVSNTVVVRQINQEPLNFTGLGGYEKNNDFQ